MMDDPRDPEPPLEDPPPWRRLAGLVLIVMFILGGLFVWHKIAQMSALQDCIASGRRDCGLN